MGEITIKARIPKELELKCMRAFLLFLDHLLWRNE